MKAPHYKYTFFLQLLLCFFLVSENNSCSRKQAMASSNKEKTTTVEPRLLYLTIESVIDSVTGNPNMKIIQQQLVDGELTGDADPTSKPGDWQISLLDKKGKRIDSLIIEDPHIQNMEISNDKGEFELRKIQYINTEVPFRFNYSSAIKEIEVIEITGDLKNKPLFRSVLIF
jgi:hypothetical protein